MQTDVKHLARPICEISYLWMDVKCKSSDPNDIVTSFAFILDILTRPKACITNLSATLTKSNTYITHSLAYLTKPKAYITRFLDFLTKPKDCITHTSFILP